ncbi:MAG: aminoacyl--tRNA ligase-related protein [Candidatus Woesearchaeota archaeon]
MSREDVIDNIKSRHIVLHPNGKEIELRALHEIDDKELKAYIISEEIKGQPKEAPPSNKAMQRLELIDYEPASDSGHFRFYPKGHLVFNLLKDWADQIAEDLGCMQIESPIIYDWSDKEIQEQAGSFHERHYSVREPKNKKDFLLRFAGDFGLFKIMKQAQFNKRMLPLRIYEFSKSFRYEKKGELSGLKRLRAFHMPDIHSFCKDIPQGWDEYEHLYKRYADLANDAGIKYAISFRIVEEFYSKHKDRIQKLLEYSGRPAHIEILSDMKHYWAVKNEFQGIDSVGGNVQLATVQLDVKDAQVYGINYSDGNEKKGCIICHSSIGSIERWIFSILEEALKKDNPVLPVWLSPVQLRLIPVSRKHLDYCKSLQIKGRFDIDDRDESLGKKIAKANMEWIPYIAVIGDKELESGNLMVSDRLDQSKQEYSIKEIEKMIEKRPYRPLPVPKLLSQRPVFSQA